jgi:hypothetical protein
MNQREQDNIIKAWLKTLPAELQNGIGHGLANSVATVLEEEFGDVYSMETLQQAWAIVQSKVFKPAKPEPSRKAIADALAGQGGRIQTGRKNHAHDGVEPTPLDDRNLSAAIHKLLQGVAAGGHLQLAKAVQAQAAEEIKAGKPWSEVHQNVKSRVTDALADLAIAKLLQDAPGNSNGERLANRQHLLEIVKAGDAHRMSRADIAKLVHLESEAQQSRSIR